MTEQENLEDYPELERDDFRAVYEYAARLVEDPDLAILILDHD